MTVYVDDTFSGTGVIDLTLGVRLNYILGHVTAVGPHVHPAQLADQTMGLGFLQLGAQTDVIDATSRIYWDNPLWINSAEWRWVPSPQTDYLADDFAVWASHIRYWFSLDCEVHLFVYGV